MHSPANANRSSRAGQQVWRLFELPLLMCLLPLVGCGRPAPAERSDPPTLPAASTAEEPAEQAVSEGWPCWRGATHDNHCPDPDPPVRWSTTENIVWKAQVPGRGHATPCIWKDQIFVATADEQEQVQSLVSLDRRTGEPLWQRTIHRGHFLPKTT